MKTIYTILIFLFSISCVEVEKNNAIVAEDVDFSFEQDELFQKEMFVKYSLVKDTVIFKFHESAKSDVFYINLHDNENTAVGAIESILDCNFNGRFIELIHSGNRNITFSLKGEKYTFDPNRIFTSKGVKATLKKYGNYSDEAFQVVRDFGEFITTKLLIEAQFIVALHNNGDKDFSILNFEGDYDNEKIASEVYINPKMDTDDFFYVTEPELFELFKVQKYNVLLQDNVNVPDDGSLSVYSALKGIKYINIEAQNGHLEKNIEMIKYTNKILNNILENRQLAIQESI